MDLFFLTLQTPESLSRLDGVHVGAGRRNRPPSWGCVFPICLLEMELLGESPRVRPCLCAAPTISRRTQSEDEDDGRSQGY